MGNGLAMGISVVLLAGVRWHACRAARDPPSANAGVIDRFEEDIVHFHVYPSTHRASLKRNGVVPTLEVTLAIRTISQILRLTLPPGYEPFPMPEKPSDCGIFVPSAGSGGPSKRKTYSRVTRAWSLTEHITSCELSKPEEARAAHVTLYLRDSVIGLSMEMNQSSRNRVPVWWDFHLRAWSPEVTPPERENFFVLQWAQQGGAGWAGGTVFESWPVLGDWDCAYSDWEGWGFCSSQCGGGVQTLRRRILMEPPEDGAGVRCDEELERKVPCNEHPCLFPCEYYGEEQVGGCTAECGGGVSVFRRHWRGEHCPEVGDSAAIRTAPCNTQPCKVDCKLSDEWTALTECSGLCGADHYWAFRGVLQKDRNDPSCQPEWRQEPCPRKKCEQLAVVRSDPKSIPLVNKAFRVAVVFRAPFLTRKILVNAPDGFKFGEPCRLYDQDMLPHYEKCRVGPKDKLELMFGSPLPPSAHGEDSRYSFSADVVNPPCDGELVPDAAAANFRCHLNQDRNRWEIELAEEGTTQWQTVSAAGYPIFSPINAEPDQPPAEK